tara:strand:- start:1615 stop:1881 length:267 start_codon:yes stop_codon:yes gene_type:complete
VSCGGGGEGATGTAETSPASPVPDVAASPVPDVYDEYHSLMCKAFNIDGTSMTEAMNITVEAQEFAEKNAGKMTDLDKLTEAMDTSRC